MKLDVLDLDVIDFADPPHIDDCLTIGVATRPVPTAASAFLSRLAFTIAPEGPAGYCVHPDLVEPGALSDVPEGPARILMDVLGSTHGLPVEHALVIESLAYSTLLAGPEFHDWRAAHRRRPPSKVDEPVRVLRTGDRLSVTLDNPARHNAFGHATRDALIDALDIALLDTTITSVEITALGPSFCSGGDLDEFGTASDVVSAHRTRLQRSAGHSVHLLRDRVTARLHGACVGAGIEVPAFADSVTALPGSWFQLPELRMGLIPGAGGTVSLPSRIGRWRTAFLALSGSRVGLDTALEWGLVDGRA